MRGVPFQGQILALPAISNVASPSSPRWAHAQRLLPALGSIQGGQALWQERVTHGTNRLSQFTAN